jgi:hypothetical protein
VLRVLAEHQRHLIARLPDVPQRFQCASELHAGGVIVGMKLECPGQR